MDPIYDLAVNYPLLAGVSRRLPDGLSRMHAGPEALAYPHPQGAPSVRHAIAAWMAQVGGHGEVDPDHLVLTLGARHALSLALIPFVQHGLSPAVMLDESTFPGFRNLVRGGGGRCIDVAMDAHGMLPDALEAAAKRSRSTVVYLQPTLHNPTTITMPLQRRIDIADVVERLGLWIIEGDVYSHLVHRTGAKLPSFTAMLPRRTLHAGGIGKLLGPGLRVGWLRVTGPDILDSTVAIIREELDGLPGLLPALVAGWMEDGTALDLLRELQTAMSERGRLARRVVGTDLVTNGSGMHAWLPTPEARALRKRLTAAGVRVGDPAGYIGSTKQPKGIRLCLGAEEDPGRLEAALRIVAACR
ncbi:MAG: PLP-dependent aminotransferase family protein [Luteibacter sp.]